MPDTTSSPLSGLCLEDARSLESLVALSRCVSIGRAAMQAGLGDVDTVELLGWFAMVRAMRQEDPGAAARARSMGERAIQVPAAGSNAGAQAAG